MIWHGDKYLSLDNAVRYIAFAFPFVALLLGIAIQLAWNTARVAGGILAVLVLGTVGALAAIPWLDDGLLRVMPWKRVEMIAGVNAALGRVPPDRAIFILPTTSRGMVGLWTHSVPPATPAEVVRTPEEIFAAAELGLARDVVVMIDAHQSTGLDQEVEDVIARLKAAGFKKRERFVWERAQ